MKKVDARLGLASAMLLSSSGCLDAPVGTDAKDLLKRGLTIDLYGTSDLLLVVDNSMSMGDKQRLLVTSLKRALGSVRCRDATGRPVDPDEAQPGTDCAVVGDGVRIGLLSTDVATGAEGCNPVAFPGHLVPLPSGEVYFDGFEKDIDAFLKSELEEWIMSIGESGCGYEAPLESLYRFLSDPAPTLAEPYDAGMGLRPVADEQLLEQRRQFVRPDSALVIVFLTDEDDCSLMDNAVRGHFPTTGTMHRGTQMCASDVDSPCCRSCEPPDTAPADADCGQLELDPSCTLGAYSELEDHPNTRCFDQKRRFGIDLTYPVIRYIRGLTHDTVEGPGGVDVPNPLFQTGKTPDQIHVALIAGVPWQLLDPNAQSVDLMLDLPSPSELNENGIWPRLVGPTADEHLMASIEPRATLAGPGADYWADPIHGHEFDNPYRATLQLSCAFPLDRIIDCTENACDCAPSEWSDGTVAPLSPNSPLCQNEDGSYDVHQKAAGAVPPSRLLQVVEAVGGMIAPICPKAVGDGKSSAHGYLATFNELSPWFGMGVPDGVCLPVALPVPSKAARACRLVERLGAHVGCTRPGRREAPLQDRDALLPPRAKLEDYSFCEVLPVPGDYEVGSEAYSCANDIAVHSDIAGYCIIDPTNDIGSDALVQFCPEDRKRRIRVLPSDSFLDSDDLTDQDLFFICD